MSIQKESRKAFLIFILPCVVVLVFVSVLPLIYSISLSLHNWSIQTRVSPPFVGLKNFVDVLTDTRFWGSLSVIGKLGGTSLFIELILGLGFALILNSRFLTKGKGFFRVVNLIPMMITPLVVGYLSRLLFDTTTGPINYLLGRNIDWLSNPTVTPWTVILTDVWEWTPFVALILLAALQSLPEEPYEAAVIDGASPLKVFTYITLPGILPAILTSIFLRFIDLARMFDVPYILTHGGPGTTTEFTSIYIYLTGFKNFNLSRAATMSWVLLVIVILIGQFFLKLLTSYRGD